jgi:hypothetical protein
MPLFETASSSSPVEAEALISITPGLFNNLFVNDIVFISFEENALEKPIILGKLYTGSAVENNTKGGTAILDTLKVRTAATIPCSTLYEFPDSIKQDYKDLKTPKKMADYIKWLENFTKALFSQLEDHFRCFKNWVQWQLKAENVEVDDGDIDKDTKLSTPFKYQEECKECEICDENCTKNKLRNYIKLGTDKKYPEI